LPGRFAAEGEQFPQQVFVLGFLGAGEAEPLTVLEVIDDQEGGDQTGEES
jgi:hypothetical protein